MSILTNYVKFDNRITCLLLLTVSTSLTTCLGYEDVSSESGYILRELLGYLKGIAAMSDYSSLHSVSVNNSNYRYITRQVKVGPELKSFL